MSNSVARSGKSSGTLPANYNGEQQIHPAERNPVGLPQTRQSSPFVEFPPNLERVPAEVSPGEQLESLQDKGDGDLGDDQHNIDRPAPGQAPTLPPRKPLQLAEDANADWAEFLDDKKFVWIRDLGKGGDGDVGWYTNSQGLNVAVKQPILSRYTLKAHAYSRNAIKTEIENLQLLGNHQNIIEMLEVLEDDNGNTAPVMIMELCDLGDLWSYREKLELRKGKYDLQNVPEITLTKLFVDMISGLNFLHTHLKACFVHGDFKPDNILVTSSGDDVFNKGPVPLLPTFKIADFARLQAIPPKEGDHEGWLGTPEYAPPPKEQKGSVAPSTDIWALGCVLQTFALGENPQESCEATIKRIPGAPSVGSKDWDKAYWRMQRLTRYRPLNVPREILMKEHDLPHCLKWYKPFSAKFNLWYSLCFERNPELRFQSGVFAQFVIPRLQSHLEVLKEEMAADEAFEMALRLRNGENLSDDEVDDAEDDAERSDQESLTFSL